MFLTVLLLRKTIPNHNLIRNIIFDFGGVICDIDISRSENKFEKFGPARDEGSMTEEERSAQFVNLVDQLETGSVTPVKFRQAIREQYLSAPSDAAIDDAWNALLVGIPAHRVRLLENIRKQYRIFLLSNSNKIHYRKYLEDFRQKYGYRDFDELFEKAWFSFRLKMKKPAVEIFEYVMADAKLEAKETLFIDDTLIHTENAALTGMHVYNLLPGEDIGDLFS